jgi:hypothetical protein
MNVPTWMIVREYIDAEIKLAFARQAAGSDPTPSERKRIGLLEAQCTRMETAVRSALSE